MTRRIKAPAILIALSILAILIVELLARSVALPLISSIRHSRQADSTVYLDAEFDVATLVAEISEASGIQYEPYVIWKRKPYLGSLVNVDDIKLCVQIDRCRPFHLHTLLKELTGGGAQAEASRRFPPLILGFRRCLSHQTAGVLSGVMDDKKD